MISFIVVDKDRVRETYSIHPPIMLRTTRDPALRRWVFQVPAG